MKFLERLGFTSTNDRLLISILKDLGFLSRDGVPQPRYFEFLDRSRSKQVVAEGIREAFSDLFAINIKANEMTTDDVRNKMRTIFAGQKTDLVIGNIAKTFRALCEYADWSQPSPPPLPVPPSPPTEAPADSGIAKEPPTPSAKGDRSPSSHAALNVSALQYHVNIVLPDTRDQAVYDAIFKSLREHLG